MMDALSFKARPVILAGGLGTRLRQVVSDKPKVLAEVNGRPFLDYVLDQIDRAGIRSAILCIGYLGNQIIERYGNRYKNVQLVYSSEDVQLGTGGAVANAVPFIDSDYVIVMNGDSYCAFDMNELMCFHINKNSNITMLVKHVADSARYGLVNISKDKSITCFIEKNGLPIPGQINAGVYVMNSSVVKAIPKNVNISLERDILPLYVNNRLFAYQSEEDFIDIGIPSDYEKAYEFEFRLCDKRGRS